VCLYIWNTKIQVLKLCTTSDSPTAKLRTCLPVGEEGDRVACTRSNCVQILPVVIYESEEMAIQAANEQCLVVCEDDWRLNMNDLVNNVTTKPRAAQLPTMCMFLRKRIMTTEELDLVAEGLKR
jgi:hypothetical protein